MRQTDGFFKIAEWRLEERRCDGGPAWRTDRRVRRFRRHSGAGWNQRAFDRYGCGVVRRRFGKGGIGGGKSGIKRRKGNKGRGEGGLGRYHRHFGTRAEGEKEMG